MPKGCRPAIPDSTPDSAPVINRPPATAETAATKTEMPVKKEDDEENHAAHESAGVVGVKMKKEDSEKEESTAAGSVGGTKKEEEVVRKKRKSSTLAEPVESTAAGSVGTGKGGIGCAQSSGRSDLHARFLHNLAGEDDGRNQSLAAGPGGAFSLAAGAFSGGFGADHPERRFAYDGEEYTHDEFIEHYGEYYGQSFWNEGIEDGKPQMYRDFARAEAACRVEDMIWTETFQALSVITMYRERFEFGDAEEVQRTIDQTWAWLERMYDEDEDASKQSLQAKLKEFQDIVLPIMLKALRFHRPEHLRHLHD